MLVHVDPIEVELTRPVEIGDSTIYTALPSGYCDHVDFTNGEYFYLTLIGANGTERVRVDDCSGGVLRVTRTTPKEFHAGECGVILFTADDAKEIFETCLKESGSDASNGSDNSPVDCTEVTSLLDSDYHYFWRLDGDCPGCVKITAANLKVWLNG